MGICPSKYHAPYKYFPELVSFRKTFQCLRLTDSEVGKLYKRFRLIDIDDSKAVDIAEVLVHLHVEKTFFNKRVFGLLDTDASGELNFEEFTVGLWNYCSIEDEFFEHFAFDLYDADNSGHIDIEEAQFMVKDIYGEEFEHNVYAKRAYHKLAELDMETINFSTFSEFAHKHQAMLYPAFALQANLKKYIMGTSFWRRQAINRLKMSNGGYRSVVDIIGAENFHKSRKLHRRLSDLNNQFRRGSKQQKSNQDLFSAPGSAYNKGGHGHDFEARRGSKSSLHDGDGKRRGSKNSDPLHGKEKAGSRRGSKIANISDDPSHGQDTRRGSKNIDPLHGEEKVGARRGSKATTASNDPTPGQDRDGGRRGSKNIDPLHGQEKAGARRGSKNTNVVVDPRNGQDRAGSRRGSRSGQASHSKLDHAKQQTIDPTARRGSKSAISPL